jgi:hypothetical protein
MPGTRADLLLTGTPGGTALKAPPKAVVTTPDGRTDLGGQRTPVSHAQ